MQGHGCTDLVTKLSPPHASGVDDCVGTNLALLTVCLVLHSNGATRFSDDARDLHVLDDAHAAGPGTLGQRLGGVDRVGDSIVGQMHATHQVVDASKRHQLRNPVAVDDVHFQPEHPRHRRASLEFFETLRRGRDADRTACAEAGGLPSFCFQCGEQVGGVLREPGEVVGCAQLTDQPGGVPGGAAGELPAFEQHHVGDPAKGQVIGDAAAHDAATHDDDACVTG